MWGRVALLLAAVGGLWLLPGCVTERTVPRQAGPYQVHEIEEWRVMYGGDQIGRLVLLEIQVDDTSLTCFRAETIDGQWVGRVRRDGRFFKNEPFRDLDAGPRDLGLYPMNQGLALLYELPGPVQVIPMEGRGQPTEAAARRLLEEADKKIGQR